MTIIMVSYEYNRDSVYSQHANTQKKANFAPAPPVMVMIRLQSDAMRLQVKPLIRFPRRPTRNVLPMPRKSKNGSGATANGFSNANAPPRKRGTF